MRNQKPLKHPVEQLLPKFETLEAALRESRKRQRCLNRCSNKVSKALGKKLANCCTEDPCGSAACPVCVRTHRLKVIPQMLEHCTKLWRWRCVTLVYYSDMMTDEDMLEWSLKKLKERLRKQLARSGIKGPVIGCFEMDFHTESQLWMPHFHLLVPRGQEPLRALRGRLKSETNLYAREGVTNRPMVVQKLEDPAEQVAYIYKTMWQRVAVFFTEEERNTKKYRLGQEQFALSLRKLDQVGFAGLEFLYGLRRHGSRLQVNLSTSNTSK